MGLKLEPAYKVIWYWSADTLFWQLSLDYNTNVQHHPIPSLLPTFVEWIEPNFLSHVATL